MKGEGKGFRRSLVLGATLIACGVFPSTAAAVTFFRGDVTVGTHPTSVAVGDFNGGAPDLAVANEGSDSVSILLGNGFGQFTGATSLSAGDAPSSVVTGSFNGDDFTDLAIASVGDDSIAIKLGDGTGGFSGTGTVSTGASSDPRALAVGDMNGDNKVDLVSANAGSSTVAVLLGNGLGDFAADASPFNAATGGAAPAANPIAVAVVNLDADQGDSDLDALIASQTNDQVLLLVGDDTGEFTGSGTQYGSMGMAGSDPSGIAIGSLNPNSPNPGNAAEPDLLTANEGLDQVFPGFGITNSIFFQLGGVLAAGADPVAVTFGDFDGDGDPDGISANKGGNTATVILSNGNGGTEVDASTAVGSSPRAIASGGFDADARDDVAVANYDSNSISILTSLRPGALTVPPATTSPAPVTKKKTCKKKKKKHRGADAAKKKCKKKKRR